LLGRCSATWMTQPAFFLHWLFLDRVLHYAWLIAHYSSLCFPHRWDDTAHHCSQSLVDVESCELFPRLALIVVLLISAFWVSRVTGLSHHSFSAHLLVLLYFILGPPISRLPLLPSCFTLPDSSSYHLVFFSVESEFPGAWLDLLDQNLWRRVEWLGICLLFGCSWGLTTAQSHCCNSCHPPSSALGSTLAPFALSLEEWQVYPTATQRLRLTLASDLGSRLQFLAVLLGVPPVLGVTTHTCCLLEQLPGVREFFFLNQVIIQMRNIDKS
jgi:hypothetical protein